MGRYMQAFKGGRSSAFRFNAKVNIGIELAGQYAWAGKGWCHNMDPLLKRNNIIPEGSKMGQGGSVAFAKPGQAGSMYNMGEKDE